MKITNVNNKKMAERRNKMLEEYPCENCIWYSTLTLNNGKKMGRYCFIQIDACQEVKPLVSHRTGQCEYYNDLRKVENQ